MGRRDGHAFTRWISAFVGAEQPRSCRQTKLTSVLSLTPHPSFRSATRPVVRSPHAEQTCPPSHASVPPSSQPIKVDGRSLVDLKAIVYAKEQKVGGAGGGASGSGGLRGLRGKRSSGDRDGGAARKDPFARSNRGVEDRQQRDEIERVMASKKGKAAQRVMAAKSSLYEKMGETTLLVDQLPRRLDSQRKLCCVGDLIRGVSGREREKERDPA